MTFSDVVEARCLKIQLVLAIKAKEYATGESRFHNFNVAARVMGTTPEKALLGMMMKHFVSVLDLIETPGDASVELIDEKIGDMTNYLVLLEGMLYQRIKEKK